MWTGKRKRDQRRLLRSPEPVGPGSARPRAKHARDRHGNDDARRVFRPACDGRYEPQQGKKARQPRDRRRCDLARTPGRELAARDRRRALRASIRPGHRQAHRQHRECHGHLPICGRAVKWLTDGRLVAHNVSSERCPGSGGTPAAAPALAAWLPVKRGLTPRGLRHSHKTWMIEDKIPEVLAELPLGHEIPGIRGAYSSRLPNSSQWRTGYHRRCSVSLVNERLTWAFFGGRYWDRTSDLFRVREALSR
jgi:hypothetical protein